MSTASLKQKIMVLCQGNHLPEAKPLCEQLCKTSPEDAEAWFLLGAIYGGLGVFEEAEICCLRALKTSPDVPAVHYNLGIARLNQHKFAESEESFKQALKLNPGYVEAYCDLGNVYKAQRDFDRAISCYRKALELDPGYVLAYYCLSAVCYDQGEYALAVECYKKLVELSDSDAARIRLAVAIPVISESNEQIDRDRARVREQVAALLEQNLRVDDPVREIAVTNFFFAYHGRDDRALQTDIARLYEHACPSLAYTAPHCKNYQYKKGNRKIKVGFISRYLMAHSIGKSSRGIIEHFSRNLFEVVVIFLSPPKDETARLIEACADISIVLPNHLDAARESIAELGLDILFYQDTGMDIFTFFLSFSRLAPVQCTSFGHPVTTGIRHLDYYISTDLWEPENGDSHYSEKLVRLMNVPSVAYYYKPEMAEKPKSRADYGLDVEDHIYICPQALFKFHPDFDAILAEILRHDSKGKLVLIEGAHANWTELLLARFRYTIGDVLERIVFVPQQPGTDFINLIRLSDVMLDTICFCGFNTTLEAFAAGTPVVTLPGELMRSRHTQSFYRKMDIMDCVASSAEEYVRIAIRLGTDRVFRKKVSQKILDRNDLLWEDMEVVREFERFFCHAVEEYDAAWSPGRHDQL